MRGLWRGEKDVKTARGGVKGETRERWKVACGGRRRSWRRTSENAWRVRGSRCQKKRSAYRFHSARDTDVRTRGLGRDADDGVGPAARMLVLMLVDVCGHWAAKEFWQ
eukprot:3899923-Rhodomonas_salina.1